MLKKWQSFLNRVGFTVKTPILDIHIKSESEIASKHQSWVQVSKGNLPNGCEFAGQEADGNPLFIARAWYENETHIGKTRKEFEGALIPWGGKEIKIESYEVYVGTQKWIDAQNGEIPMGALVAGQEADGNPLYVARAKFGGGMHIGKVSPRFGAALIPYNGRENAVQKYQVLVVG